METNYEKNVLIAESIGMQKTSLGWYDAEEILNIKGGDNTFDDLLFDTDMNWLFAVVKHINLLNDYEYSVKIMTMDVEIHNSKGQLVVKANYDFDVCDLEKSIYDTVVRFFQWYNVFVSEIK